MIVVATHGRSGLERLSFGSVTTTLLHRSELPLLLVRPLGLHSDQATVGQTTVSQ
jgi:nucleotide-binding universal stress UspA family protein